MNRKPKLRFKGFVEEWEERKVGEVINTNPFKSYLAEPQINGEFEVIQQGDNPIIGYANGKPYKDYEDVVLFGDHTLSLYKPKMPFFLATDGIRIISSINKMNSNYLFYLIKRYNPKPEGYKRYYSILIDCSCYISNENAEQIKIGSFFYQLDYLITAQQQKYDKLINIKKSMLEKMFPKENSDVPEIRFKGFTDKWEERRLGDICQITMGQSPAGITYRDTPADFILVQGNADLKSGWVYPRTWTTQKTKTACVGDLIMSVRAPAGAMGKTAYNVVLGRGVAGIKGNEYIYQILVKMDSDLYWKKRATGSTFESINSDDINNAKVKVPKDLEQQKIGSFSTNLTVLLPYISKSWKSLKALRNLVLRRCLYKGD